MSNLLRDQVKQFHTKFGIKDLTYPGVPDPDVIRLRLLLVCEEYRELANALGFSSSVLDEHYAELCVWEPDPSKVDLVETADATGDLKYVIFGLEHTFGFNGDPISDMIHESNMAKEGGGNRPDGKIKKPPGWVAPDIRSELLRQGWIEQ